MWELGDKGRALKNWCFWTVVLEKTLGESLDSKEIQPVHSKGNQPWLFTGSADAETPILWPPDAKSLLIGKDPDAEKDWRQEEKVMTEDEMIGWHHAHQFNGQVWAIVIVKDRVAWLGDSEGQGSLAAAVHGVAHMSWTQLSDWTITTSQIFLY